MFFAIVDWHKEAKGLLLPQHSTLFVILLAAPPLCALDELDSLPPPPPEEGEAVRLGKEITDGGLAKETDDSGRVGVVMREWALDGSSSKQTLDVGACFVMVEELSSLLLRLRSETEMEVFFFDERIDGICFMDDFRGASCMGFVVPLGFE